MGPLWRNNLFKLQLHSKYGLNQLCQKVQLISVHCLLELYAGTQSRGCLQITIKSAMYNWGSNIQSIKLNIKISKKKLM